MTTAITILFSLAFLIWVAWPVGSMFMQDKALRDFYGEGNYSSVAAGLRPMGSMIGIGYIEELRASLDSEAEYQCRGVTKLDGTPPSMSFPDDSEPVCCLLADDQMMIPYKIDGDSLHLICGEWPVTEEVILSPIPDRLKQAAGRKDA
ncbi:hypothetical protein [Marinobacterium aestuariivivens]|uniref:DUF3304 domain-containing protein n=1 Tax=Marinobacterium aestuariivivens TaxID=1698799 RepID=A0ABW2A9E9_9GAMM